MLFKGLGMLEKLSEICGIYLSAVNLTINMKAKFMFHFKLEQRNASPSSFTRCDLKLIKNDKTHRF